MESSKLRALRDVANPHGFDPYLYSVIASESHFDLSFCALRFQNVFAFSI